MTSTSLQGTIKNAVHKLAKALEDAKEIKVETRYVLTDAPAEEAGGESGLLLARTIMQLDGDAEVVIPMHRGEGGQLAADSAAFDLHMSNVKAALEYRANLLASLLRTVLS